MKLDKILVPLDGSLLAEAALPKAVELAQDSGAQLLLLRAAENQVVDLLGLEQALAGCDEERNPPPLAAGNGMRQALQRTELQLVVPFAGAGMVGLGAEEFGARGQFVPQHGRDDLPLGPGRQVAGV